MQRLLKRHFWLVYVVAAALCALFAKRAANHVFAKEYLAEATKVEAPPPGPIQRPKVLRSKSGVALADRNIFCSECEPLEPVVEDVLNADGSPNQTSLPLRLIATNMATVSEQSIAIVQNNELDVSGAFTPGDRIPGAGEVMNVGKDFVDFRNARSGRLERLALATGDAPKAPVAAARPAPPPPRPAAPPQPAPQDEAAKMRAELLSDIEAGVKKTSENSYTVARSVVDKVLSNPMAMRGVRIRPDLKDGKVTGFKVARLKPDSALSKIGVLTNDTVHAINGMPMTSADKALEIYTKLREVNSIQVDLTRGGKRITMRYTIE